MRVIFSSGATSKSSFLSQSKPLSQTDCHLPNSAAIMGGKKGSGIKWVSQHPKTTIRKGLEIDIH